MVHYGKFRQDSISLLFEYIVAARVLSSRRRVAVLIELQRVETKHKAIWASQQLCFQKTSPPA